MSDKVGMNGLEYLRQTKFKNGSAFGMDLNNLKEGKISDEEIEKIKETLTSKENLLNLNEDVDVEKMRDLIENHPEKFKQNLAKRVQSDMKKLENGEITQTSFIESLNKALLDKKPSKSKYTRKKKNKK